MDAADQLKANLATLDRMRQELAQEHVELTQRDRIARVLAANDGLCMDSEDDRETLLNAITEALALGNLAEPAGDPPPTAGDSTAPTDTPARTVVRWSEDAGTGFAPVDPLLRSPRQLLNGALEDFDAVLVNNPSREDLLTIKAMIRSAVRLMEHGVEFNDRDGK